MIALLRARRSIREYTGQVIETERMERLKEAALRSPSSRNIDPWELIIADDRNLLVIPEPVKVECLIAVGYAAERRAPLPRKSLKTAKVRTNRY